MTSRAKKSAGERLGEKLQGRLEKSKFAEAIGVDRSLVSRWISGERKPNTQQRVFIFERWPTIGILDWDEGLAEQGAA